MIRRYRLVGKLAVPCSSREEMLLSGASIGPIKASMVGPVAISTAFLGLDHNWSGEGDPLLFETMTFLRDADLSDQDGTLDSRTIFAGGLTQRCSTWDEAEYQHAATIEIVTTALRDSDTRMATALREIAARINGSGQSR